MQSQLGHLQVNIAAANLPFYKGLMGFLEWHTIVEMEAMLGVVDKNGASLWFVGYANDAHNDYDGAGMNHLAFSVGAQSDVDSAAAYLTGQGVTLLFNTPHHRAEFAQGPDQTYYQVMFETPDRLLFEVVYIGPKS